MSHDTAVSVPSRKAQRRSNITSGDQSHPTWHPTTYVVLSLLLILLLSPFTICTCWVKHSNSVSQSLLCLFSTFADRGTTIAAPMFRRRRSLPLRSPPVSIVTLYPPRPYTNWCPCTQFPIPSGLHPTPLTYFDPPPRLATSPSSLIDPRLVLGSSYRFRCHATAPVALFVAFVRGVDQVSTASLAPHRPVFLTLHGVGLYAKLRAFVSKTKVRSIDPISHISISDRT